MSRDKIDQYCIWCSCKQSCHNGYSLWYWDMDSIWTRGKEPGGSIIEKERLGQKICDYQKMS